MGYVFCLQLQRHSDSNNVAYVQGQESEVPYAELIKSLGGFYNMSKWQSMPPLTCAPKDMSHVQIIGLVEYLKSHSGAGVDDPFVFWKCQLLPPPPPPAWSPTPLIDTHLPSPPPLPARSPTPPIPTCSPSPPPPPAWSPTPPVPPHSPILSPSPPLSPPIPPHSPPIPPLPASPPIPSCSPIPPPVSKHARRALAANNDLPR